MSTPSVVISTRSDGFSLAETSRRRERRFFTGMAIAMAVVCFAGFAPSYFLKAHFRPAPLSPLVHIHGMLFTAWMGLLIAQASLVASGRVKVHQKLGIGSIALLVMLVLSGGAMILGLAHKEIPGIPRDMLLAMLALAVVSLLAFPTLIGAALVHRRNAGAHKRLMLLGTTVMLGAAVHRLLMWSVDPAVSPPVFFGATDLFIVAIGVYDLVGRSRIHPATLWGGLFVIGAQIGSLFLAGSKSWLTFAHWVTG